MALPKYILSIIFVFYMCLDGKKCCAFCSVLRAMCILEGLIAFCYILEAIIQSKVLKFNVDLEIAMQAQ